METPRPAPQAPGRDQLLLRIGAAKKEAGRTFGFMRIRLPQEGEEVTHETFTFRLDKKKLEKAELRDGHYLLRSNLEGEDPSVLWERYMQRSAISQNTSCRSGGSRSLMRSTSQISAN